ncbi:hypothetical protein RRG08_046940 [Elysia crispata]|uniref:Uncharacterized protein n=1 Tax=Elysia crispata TaxID=231223 RepID=A0AAE1A9X0_9GAST|nr:hypothetical protein RRG08_046940 [Elysia crispata]
MSTDVVSVKSSRSIRALIGLVSATVVCQLTSHSQPRGPDHCRSSLFSCLADESLTWNPAADLRHQTVLKSGRWNPKMEPGSRVKTPNSSQIRQIGVECGKLHHCVTDARCLDRNGIHRCECSDGRLYGNGELQCLPRGDHTVWIQNDPHLKNFHHEFASLLTPCPNRVLNLLFEPEVDTRVIVELYGQNTLCNYISPKELLTFSRQLHLPQRTPDLFSSATLAPKNS